MKPITKGQIKIIQTIISTQKLHDVKADMLNDLTGCRTTSVADLYFNEANDLIKILNGKQQLNDQDKGQRMKRHIFAMAHEMGWITEETMVMKEGGMKQVKNYDAVHNWVAKYGHLNKKLAHLEPHQHLNRYPYKELPILVTAFKNVYISKLKVKPQ